MAVYKSRRKDATAEFISTARELRKITIRIIKRFPAGYRWIITNNMLTLANDVYTNSLKANAIYIHKDMSEHDYELRRRYLAMAISSAEALLGEITFCYELVSGGNNFFSDRGEYNHVFQVWTTAGNAALQKIRGVLNSDRKRWNGFCKKE